MIISELMDLLDDAVSEHGDIEIELYDRQGERVSKPFVHIMFRSQGRGHSEEIACFNDNEGGEG